jgi:hypothetical protein
MYTGHSPKHGKGKLYSARSDRNPKHTVFTYGMQAHSINRAALFPV